LLGFSGCVTPTAVRFWGRGEDEVLPGEGRAFSSTNVPSRRVGYGVEPIFGVAVKQKDARVADRVGGR